MDTGGRIEEAVGALGSARALLADRLHELDLLPLEDQLVIAQQLETVRNQVLALDLLLLTGLDRSDAAARTCQGTCAGCSPPS